MHSFHGTPPSWSNERSPFCLGADQSLENTDSYPQPSLGRTRLWARTKSSSSAGWLDISREACRIGSGDKTSDLSSRERKRAGRIKGHGERRGGVSGAAKKSGGIREAKDRGCEEM